MKYTWNSDAVESDDDLPLDDFGPRFDLEVTYDTADGYFVFEGDMEPGFGMDSTEAASLADFIQFCCRQG